MSERTEAQKRATKKWNDTNMKERYDRVQLLVPKGRKADLQSHASSRGESLNGFVNRAIDNQLELDNMKEGVTDCRYI